MLTVYFAGLMYFHGCDTATKRVHVPDGTKGLPGPPPVPEHYASLWIQPGLVKDDDWFDSYKKEHEVNYYDEFGQPVTETVLEYGIPRHVTLTFPDETCGPATFVNLATTLRRLDTLAAPGPFVVDHSGAEKIADIPLRAGTLEAFAFTEEVAVIQWTIPNPGVVITAAAADATKTITLEPIPSDANVEIVFGNTSDLLSEARSRRALRSRAKSGSNSGVKNEDHTHYRLYSKLRMPPRNDHDIYWIDIPRVLDPLDYQHPYLAHVHTGSQIPDPGCEGSCC